jgi:hypothetical protein
MDNIGQLASIIGKAVIRSQQQARVATGVYAGGSVLVGNQSYNSQAAGDSARVDGKPVLCLVDGKNCFVVSDK